MDKTKCILGLLAFSLGTSSFVIQMEKRDKPPATSVYTNSTISRSQKTATTLDANSLGEDIPKHWIDKFIYYLFNQDSGMDFSSDYIPKSSFRVLNKLRDIAFKSCAGKLRSKFLESSYVVFQAAYEDIRVNPTEDLTKEEEVKIFELLNNCQNSLVPLKFGNNGSPCPDDVVTVVKDNIHVVINFTSSYHSDYYMQDRHLSMEIPWNMIDLTLAMCIDAFIGSSVLYHKMKQAMEKLFIKDLQVLWENPPTYAKIYRRLHGPDWKENAENLEKCVEAAHIVNPELERLRRPKDMTIIQ